MRRWGWRLVFADGKKYDVGARHRTRWGAERAAEKTIRVGRRLLPRRGYDQVYAEIFVVDT